MGTKTVIEYLYGKHEKYVGPIVNSLLSDFTDKLKMHHKIIVKNDYVEFLDIQIESVFRRVSKTKIFGVEEFRNVIALILPKSVLFFSKTDSNINVYIKSPDISLLERMVEKIKDAIF